MTKIYNIDEYGSNLSPEIYDTKILTEDNSYFYESLGTSFQKFKLIYIS